MASGGPLRALWIWGPLFAYIVLIFYLSSLSQVGGGNLPPDWLSHGAEYYVLALLVARALHDGFRRPLSPALLSAAFALCVVCGVADEIWQRFTPDRLSDVRDVVSDAAGAALGIATLVVARRFRAPGGVA